jgi:hypothetical protein
MTPFPVDVRPTFTDVIDVTSPLGNVNFSTPLSLRRIGDGWATWSHGYAGDVHFTDSKIARGKKIKHAGDVMKAGEEMEVTSIVSVMIWKTALRTCTQITYRFSIPSSGRLRPFLNRRIIDRLAESSSFGFG